MNGAGTPVWYVEIGGARRLKRIPDLGLFNATNPWIYPVPYMDAVYGMRYCMDYFEYN